MVEPIRMIVGFLGELGHPQGFGDPNRLESNPNFNIVSLTNISHVVEDVEIHSDIAFAKIKTLDTPSGKMLKSLHGALGKGSVVFRPRGIGNINSDGTVDLKEIVSFDAITAEDDSFKDLQDIYNSIQPLPDLGKMNMEFQRKNEDPTQEQ